VGDLLRAVTERPKDLVALSDRRAIKKGLPKKGVVYSQTISAAEEKTQ
jgi:hypothetical protein